MSSPNYEHREPDDVSKYDINYFIRYLADFEITTTERNFTNVEILTIVLDFVPKLLEAGERLIEADLNSPKFTAFISKYDEATKETYVKFHKNYLRNLTYMTLFKKIQNKIRNMLDVRNQNIQLNNIFKQYEDTYIKSQITARMPHDEYKDMPLSFFNDYIHYVFSAEGDDRYSVKVSQYENNNRIKGIDHLLGLISFHDKETIENFIFKHSWFNDLFFQGKYENNYNYKKPRTSIRKIVNCDFTGSKFDDAYFASFKIKRGTSEIDKEFPFDESLFVGPENTMHFENCIFSDIISAQLTIINAEFRNCKFKFKSNYLHIRNTKFVDCVFNDCKLDRLSLKDTAFNSCVFEGTIFYISKSSVLSTVDFTNSDTRGLQINLVEYNYQNPDEVLDGINSILNKEKVTEEEQSIFVDTQYKTDFLIMPQPTQSNELNIEYSLIRNENLNEILGFPEDDPDFFPEEMYNIFLSVVDFSIFKDCTFNYIVFGNCAFGGVKFENVDFRYSHFASVNDEEDNGFIMHCVFKNCNFDETVFHKVSIMHCIFENCTFNSAKFCYYYYEQEEERPITNADFLNDPNERLYSGFQNCKFNNCDFVRCEIFDYNIMTSHFIQCDLKYSKFNNSLFHFNMIDNENDDREQILFLDCDMERSNFELIALSRMPAAFSIDSETAIHILEDIQQRNHDQVSFPASFNPNEHTSHTTIDIPEYGNRQMTRFIFPNPEEDAIAPQHEHHEPMQGVAFEVHNKYDEIDFQELQTFFIKKLDKININTVFGQTTTIQYLYDKMTDFIKQNPNLFIEKMTIDDPENPGQKKTETIDNSAKLISGLDVLLNKVNSSNFTIDRFEETLIKHVLYFVFNDDVKDKPAIEPPASIESANEDEEGTSSTAAPPKESDVKYTDFLKMTYIQIFVDEAVYAYNKNAVSASCVAGIYERMILTLNALSSSIYSKYNNDETVIPKDITILYGIFHNFEVLSSSVIKWVDYVEETDERKQTVKAMSRTEKIDHYVEFVLNVLKINADTANMLKNILISTPSKYAGNNMVMYAKGVFTEKDVSPQLGGKKRARTTRKRRTMRAKRRRGANRTVKRVRHTTRRRRRTANGRNKRIMTRTPSVKRRFVS